MTSERFVEAVFEAPAVGEDDLVAALWALGLGGSWSEEAAPGRIRLHAYFPGGAAPDPEILTSLVLAAGPVEVSSIGPAPDRDWIAEWGAAAGLIEVGDRFLVDPGESASAREPGVPSGRFLLRIPARTAFGLGSHESTRLVVELLERESVAGRRVLDLGTGSGILAFAAALLGAARVDACDLDPAAALLAEQYRRSNRIDRVTIWVGTIQALAGEERSYDLALVNVVPAEIVADLAALAAVLRPRGRAIFSGILADQTDEVLDVLAAHGFAESGRRSQGEWSALAMELSR